MLSEKQSAQGAIPCGEGVDRVSHLFLRLPVSFHEALMAAETSSSLRLLRSLPGSHLSHLHVREVRAQASGHLQACLPCFTAEPQEDGKLPGGTSGASGGCYGG